MMNTPRINVQNVHIKMNVLKHTNTENSMNLQTQLFIDKKIIFKSSKGKKLYKLRPLFSEGNFANIKSHQEFTKSRRIGIKSGYRFKTRSNSH